MQDVKTMRLKKAAAAKRDLLLGGLAGTTILLLNRFSSW